MSKLLIMSIIELSVLLVNEKKDDRNFVYLIV